MLDASRAIGEATCQKYYREKWALGSDGYYAENSELRGHWYGEEAARLGLIGQTQPRDFDRIFSGRRPDAAFDLDDLTNWTRKGRGYAIFDKTTSTIQAEVVQVSGDARHRGWKHNLNTEKVYRSAGAAKNGAVRELIGKEIHYRQEHKARRAWDLVTRPGKTVALAAVVGGDQRIIEAHRRANAAMLKYAERLIQARGGGDNPAITTGRFIVARFEHYTARPEEIQAATGETVLYPAALLHTHNVMANWTSTDEGKVKSIDPYELFKNQHVLKAVYQAHMAHSLRWEMGFQTVPGKNGASEIDGYTAEYIASESARGIAIQKELEAQGLSGPRAAALVAKSLRNEKLELTPEETHELHKANEAAHGNQNAKLIGESIERLKTLEFAPAMSAEKAVSMAKRSLAERESVFEHWALVSKALEYGQGDVLEDAIEANILSRTQTQEMAEQGIRADFMPVWHVREGAPGVRYTTDIQHTYETDLCELMVAGRDRVEPLARNITAEEIADAVQSVIPLRSEYEVARARTMVEELVTELRERVNTLATAEDDPYFVRWEQGQGLKHESNPDVQFARVGFQDWIDDLKETAAAAGTGSEEFMAKLRDVGELQAWATLQGSISNNPGWFQTIDRMREEFAAWRQAEVTNDTRRLNTLESRLTQLENVDNVITVNRLKLKVDAAGRFEQLSGRNPNADQINAIHTILTSPDRISAIVGVAGSGKTTSLETIKAVAEEQQYRVLGLAPTSKAVEKLEQNGIRSATMQGFLIANTPEAIARVRGAIDRGEQRLGKLTERLAKTHQQTGRTRDSLARANEAILSTRGQYNKAKWITEHRRPSRSVADLMQQNRRREYFRNRLPILVERLHKLHVWKTAATARLKVLEARVPEIENRIAQTTERIASYQATAYKRGVSLDGTPRLIFADESSLAGNRQFAELFRQLNGPQDRIVLVGDPGQHESIEASRAFDLLLQAGIRRGDIYEIVRQKDKTLKLAVEKCTWGKHGRAIDILHDAGHIVQHRRRADRLNALVELFRLHPENSLVIVPDNKTRHELNAMIRDEWKQQGRLTGQGLTGVVLTPKQELTGVDREVAAKYELGQVVRFRDGIGSLQIEPGSYWSVVSRDAKENQVKIYRTKADQTMEHRTFNAAKHGNKVEVYEKQEREFAVGDRILFKKNERRFGIVNGTAAVVTAVDSKKRTVTVALKRDGKEVTWSLPAAQLSSLPHVEYGYVTTSYSVQGDTAGYTYAHMDTGMKGAKNLLSRAMVYVSLSRPEFEAKLVTNDVERLRQMMQTGQEKAMALSPEDRYQYTPEQSNRHQQGQGFSAGA